MVYQPLIECREEQSATVLLSHLECSLTMVFCGIKRAVIAMENPLDFDQ